MRPRRAIASLLVLAATLLGGLARWIGGADGQPPAGERPPSESRPAPRREVPPPAAPAPERAGGALESLGDPELDAQVRAVVASFDRTGRPPAGVAQGGRRRGARGVFDNREGRLPRRPGGYYTETDVWPRGPGGRGAVRLVLGREGEVYYTGDHYRTFTRIR